jgi:hypothetical protein
MFIRDMVCGPNGFGAGLTTSRQTPLPDDAELVSIQDWTAVGTPIASVTPADGARVTTRVNVIGTAQGNVKNWVLDYVPVSGTTYVTIGSGKTQLLNGVLGTFDPTLLLNGIYQLRLTVNFTDNQSSQETTASVVVDGEQKVGNFTLSFTDLDVPVAGIDMQVVRTYDSRNKQKGDFGVGWTLDVKNIRVEKSCVLGQGWYSTQNGDEYCISAKQSHIVVVTFPNGKVYRYEPKIVIPSNSGLCTTTLAGADIYVKFDPVG